MALRPRRFAFSAAFLILVHIETVCAVRHNSSATSQWAFAKKGYVEGISDFGKVNEYLYRGTQPNSTGVEELKKLGVDTIVDLREERHDTMVKEREHAESLGMRLINIPGNGWSPPTDEQVAQFFSVIRERPRHKIFVHCWLGGDRSGVFIATYRIAFERWTPDQALQEMRAFHFKGFWHPAMKSYIRNFPERLQRSPVLARFRHSKKRPTRKLWFKVYEQGDGG